MSGSSSLECTRALKALSHTEYCSGSPLNTEIERLGKSPETNSCLLTVLCSKFDSVSLPMHLSNEEATVLFLTFTDGVSLTSGMKRLINRCSDS